MTALVRDGWPADDGGPVLRPDEIDGEYRPRHHESAVTHRYGDEDLVVDRHDGEIHLLNPTAALLWECFDGTVSVEELAAEVSGAWGVPFERAKADTLGMAQAFGRLGLLAGVAPPRPEPRAQPELPGPDDVIEPFSAIDSTGNVVTLPPLGRAVLLVNWSPACGYCRDIAAELSSCRASLAERGIELALLTTGSKAENEALLAPLSLADAALYRTSDPAHSDPGATEPLGAPDPLARLGTPVAYLIDEVSVVARPLAYGTTEVLALARAAAGISASSGGVPGDGADETSEMAAARRRVLPAASDVCGSAGATPVAAARPSRQWAATSVFEIAGLTVGIRSDSVETDALVRRALARFAHDHEREAPANFSVVFGNNRARGAAALSMLMLADRPVLRSRSRRRVLEALASHLSALFENEDDGLLRTRNVAVVTGSGAVLLPSSGWYWMEHLQPRLARLGVLLSDEPHALVDPSTCELVIPESSAILDAGVLADLGDRSQTSAEPSPAEPGRYPIALWGYEEPSQERQAKPTAASTVAGVLPAVTGSPDMLGHIMAALGGVFEHVQAVPVPAGSRQEVIASAENLIAISRLPT